MENAAWNYCGSAWRLSPDSSSKQSACRRWSVIWPRDWHFPPPAFVRLEPPTGGVSIDLTTHIHRPTVGLGEDEWLTGKFEIETSTGGLAVEHGVIATLDGVLVAESFQTRLTAKD